MVCVKKSLLIVLVLCICLSGCGTRAEESKEEALPIVYIGGSDRPYVFDYNSLEDGAQLIVKVTALEKTDQQVRTTYLDWVDRYEPVSGGSYRKLLIDQVIKGDKELEGTDITFLQECFDWEQDTHKGTEKVTYCYSGARPLEKGKQYIMFLIPKKAESGEVMYYSKYDFQGIYEYKEGKAVCCLNEGVELNDLPYQEFADILNDLYQ